MSLIDHNPRGGVKEEFEPADAIRYNERTVAERINARLREAFGARQERVHQFSRLYRRKRRKVRQKALRRRVAPEKYRLGGVPAKGKVSPDAPEAPANRNFFTCRPTCTAGT